MNRLALHQEMMFHQTAQLIIGQRSRALPCDRYKNSSQTHKNDVNDSQMCMLNAQPIYRKTTGPHINLVNSIINITYIL